MICATDFLKTAETLNKSKDEWDIRTSISRSYYAVYLEIRQSIFKYSNGIDFPKDKHGSVNRCLGSCSDKSWKKIALNFGNLRQHRTDADYKIHKTIDQKQGPSAMMIAQELLKAYQANLKDANLANEFQGAVKDEFCYRHSISL